MATFTHLLCLLLLMPVFAISQAQTPCGIFATKNDFVSNNVTYSFDECDVKVRLNKDLVAYHRENKLRFDFNFIYGYSDGKNLYRAYGIKSLWDSPGYFRVIHDSDVIIYERIRRDHRANPQYFYYFSLSKDSPIQPLRKKFYNGVSQGIRINLSALRASLNLPVVPGDNSYVSVGHVGEKKKPDISARLQTTTRRPKIFNVSW